MSRQVQEEGRLLERVKWVLDTSLLLGGKEPPPGEWLTTPEASQEISDGGRDARRFDFWMAKGLQVRSPNDRSLDQVDEAGLAAGNLGRLSDADRSLIGLALEESAILMTDDFTMLDLADRLNVSTQTIQTDGIEGSKNFRPRCTGCGKWTDEMPPREECLVCGSPVVLKPSKQ